MIKNSTNKCVDCFLWDTSSTNSDQIFMSSDSSLSLHTKYTESKFLPFRDYFLVVRHSNNRTIDKNVSY